MDLTFDSTATGRPLIRNVNGTLRIGRWWHIYADAEYFTSTAVVSDTYYSAALVSSAAAAAKSASAWTTQQSSGGAYNDAFLGVQMDEDYPYYNPASSICYAFATVTLLSFSLPIIPPRFIRRVVINTSGGGSTLMEYGADENYVPYPLYADPWSYTNGTVGFRFSSSKPSSPSAVGSSQTNVYLNDLTNSAVGGGHPIVVDSGGAWTRFSSNSQVRINCPTLVNSALQGNTKVWLATYFPASPPAFTIPSDYSRALHLQNARAGAHSLWVYA